MDYEFIDWAVRIHTPVHKLTDSDVKEVAELLMKNTLVFWRGESLSPEDVTSFSKRFGSHDYSFTPEDYDSRSEEHQSYLVGREHSGLIRIAGKKNSAGRSGIFPHKEPLDWHIDKVYNNERKTISLLYSVTGSKNSVTRFSNNIKSYDHLSDKKKDEYNRLKITFGMGRWRKDVGSAAYERAVQEINVLPVIEHNLICANPFGQKGIFISPLQTEAISGMTYSEMVKFTDDLLEYVTQDKFVYAHEWEDGDLILSDQVFGLHKRDYFENISERLLYRMGIGMENIFPNLTYEGYNGTL